MDGSALKHKVITNNIANANTPGFKKSQVSFQQSLAQALQKGDLSEMTPEVRKITNTSLRTDGNNVDIEMELADLAQNNLYFDGLSRFLSSQISLLRHAITEGRK